MKAPEPAQFRKPFVCVATLMLASCPGFSHDIGTSNDGDSPPHYDWSVAPPTKVAFDLNQTQLSETNRGLAIASAFQPFAPAVKTHWDDTYFYVESNGMPTHPMMIGITSWQQQVPLSQSYFGNNAWRFPLSPVPAAKPQTIKDHFLRGAIAIAVNGVPIFNPQNNRREISAEIGELDKFGGHAGRADDYHYHAAPLHLQKLVGEGNPIAFALDGYPIYGLAEPDGSKPVGLDEFNGHNIPQLGYHYHASNKYPYINGGFHGEVTERDGQVDPQPRARPVRFAMTPLRGAVITDFKAEADGKSYTLTYTLGGKPAQLHYAAVAEAVRFDFTDDSGQTTTKTYPTHFRDEENEKSPRQSETNSQRPPRDPNRQPWLKVHAKEMDLNHDGTLTREEFTSQVEKTFTACDRNHDGKLTTDEYDGPPMRSTMGGYIKQHYRELLDETGVITKASLMKEATRMFEKSDFNHDGQLSPEETALPPGYKPEPPRK